MTGFSALATLLILAPCAHATLYSANTGYRYTTGNYGYWGDDFWAAGNLRFNGGWYPNGQFAVLTDSYYRWVVAPGVGLEKGFSGIGKARVGFTFYDGELRESDAAAHAYSVEIGGFRALNAEWSADLAYRLTTGNLFAGTNRIFDAATGQSALVERWSVTHQGIASAAWMPLVSWRPRFDASLAVGRASGGIQLLTESLSASLPVYRDLRAMIDFAFVHSNNGIPDHNYVGFGAFYAFAGARSSK